MIRDSFETRRARNPFEKVSASVYEALLECITSNSSELGDCFTLDGLTVLLGISRTPVRSAVARLEEEGFVRQVKYRGIQITKQAELCSADMYLARSCLEVMACGLTAERITPAEYRQLCKILRRNQEAGAGGDIQAFLDTDGEFHTFIVACSKNPFLEEAYTAMDAYIRRGRYSSIMRGLVQKALTTEHSLIVNCLKYGNAYLAREAMQMHMFTCSGNTISHYKQMYSRIRSHSLGPAEMFP